jgi:hypothetical protein
MTVILLTSWVALIYVSLKAAEIMLKKTNNL